MFGLFKKEEYVNKREVILDYLRNEANKVQDQLCEIDEKIQLCKHFELTEEGKQALLNNKFMFCIYYNTLAKMRSLMFPLTLSVNLYQYDSFLKEHYEQYIRYREELGYAENNLCN